MKQDQDIIEYISHNINNFSKRQRLIANYIVTHYDRAAYMTASRLAEEVGVSESTVVRFAAEVGFSGYQKLQRSLQEVTRTQLTSMQRMEVASRRIGMGSILEDVLKSDIDKLEKAISEVDEQQFQQTVDMFLHARQIYVLGVRSSATLASFASINFNLVFEHVTLVQTKVAEEMLEQLLRVKNGDVVFGISFPRYSKTMIKALQFAKKRGATVVVMTDSVHSPIIKEADFSLITGSGDTTSFADSLVAPLSVLNALICAVGMRKKQEIAKTFEQLEEIWNEYEVYN